MSENKSLRGQLHEAMQKAAELEKELLLHRDRVASVDSERKKTVAVQQLTIDGLIIKKVALLWPSLLYLHLFSQLSVVVTNAKISLKLSGQLF